MSELNDLILGLTPIHRQYMQGEGTPLDQVALMWSAGDVLKAYLLRFGGTPNRLFREIYGKGEGKMNIKQKSYISREFQSRSYRVCNMYPKVDDLRRDLSTLVSLTAFLKAMPFFDNPKYKLAGKDREELLRVLNKPSTSKEASQHIAFLRKKFIGKVNSRTQRLGDLETEKNIVNKLINTIKANLELTFEDAIAAIPVTQDQFKSLSRLTGALTAEGLKWVPIEEERIKKEEFKEYAIVVNSLLSEQNAKRRRRFRRIVSPEKLADIAEALFAFTDSASFRKNKARLIETLNV